MHSRIVYTTAEGTVSIPGNLHVGGTITSEGASPAAAGAHASTHVPGGSDPLTTAVAGTIAVGDAAAVGSAASFARSDHRHALPAPALPAAQITGAGTAGAATTVARADHVHPMAALVAADVSDASANGRSLITAADYSAMRTLLGLVIGTTVQAYHAILAALAGLTGAADKLAYFTGATSMATTNFFAWGRSMLGLTVAADKSIYYTDANTAATYDLTAAARTVLDDTTVGAMRTTLGADYLPSSFTALATVGWLSDISRLSWRRVMSAPRTGATFDFFGMTEAAAGTRTTPALASTNIKTSTKRTNIESAASAQSAAGHVTAFVAGVGELWRGNAARLGGFIVYCQFSVDTAVSTQRGCAGIGAYTAMTHTTTSTIEDQVNCAVLGWRNGDTTMSIFHNDAAGTCTRVDLGVSFPVVTSADVYEVIFAAPPNGSAIEYWVRLNRDDALVASGSLTTDIPSTTTFFACEVFVNNGGTASAVDCDIMRWEIACP